MKLFHSHRPLLAFTLLALFFICSCWPSCAAARVQPHRSSSSALERANPGHQLLRVPDNGDRNPFKKVDSSFRKIPNSRANPTQNKFKPRADDRGRR